ncbi:aminoacyl-tRNA hydrolase [Allofrancisella guangzhouensis]|uniref:Peptidyl-tRNA hydrolase n=1 Tax=Allofrancisella guangzhouensis TaxID=594679 RepID=A0A0A8E5J1_9GAMM|nr:aminoacyl-tRNA hydrolase [Allofrancisella guangzhouensis]AJC49273.1 peptidyl-tRNA hydrolase [Allofrancisella guangzhouensis]MBK2027718.1 aminoacyl-tRNA hydrolase [Allofrancisella guangzhouensis]MBK2044009.1 aminoacyl-tRNA hydrolase [Allofrancisella guangzhouensis]MBK2046393.1 aminoacyl-tRNA hydrolase [Allofrancisella guangzhouensis]
MTKIKMIVGLGNIGNEYQDTRHNVGEWFISKIAQDKQESFSSNSKLNSNIAKVNIAYNNVILVFPTTYMNNSGLAVSKVANFYKIESKEILIVHDELDIDCGQIRLKKGGGHGGHNGLRSIHQYLGTNEYLRLRIGIGHPGHKSKVSNYVLSKPSVEQKKQIDIGIDNAICFLDDIINYQLESVMQRLHTK